MPRTPALHSVRIDKLVHGGTGLGVLKDGKKAFVWGALPGEFITFRTVKNRKDFVEGVVDEIHEVSPARVMPKDELYLSTSPWQILDENAEDKQKLEILTETFSRTGAKLPIGVKSIPTHEFYNYRNKMEYSFYGDENGLHLALYNRGTHRKQPVLGSSIAKVEIDEKANKILSILQKNNIRAGDLKTLVLRASQSNEVVASLYVKDKDFPKIEELGGVCGGLSVVYSNPKSPASIRTEDRFTFGNIALVDTLLEFDISYDVFSFFQVNIPVFIKALKSISRMLGGDAAIDMYSGVGSIGLSLSSVSKLVENDPSNIFWAEKNVLEKPGVELIHAKSEDALIHVSSTENIIVDPPRAGLHTALVEKILETKPPKIIYLSCNPSTQARDIEMLQREYKLVELECYNFFPRTPHIESLGYLVRI